MPPKPADTDHEPLELADGWDKETARPASASRAVAPEADPLAGWETPLEDVSWGEPSVKKPAGSAPEPAPPEEVLPPVAGEKLVELLWDENEPAESDLLAEEEDPFADPAPPEENSLAAAETTAETEASPVTLEGDGGEDSAPAPEDNAPGPLDFSRLMAQLSSENQEDDAEAGPLAEEADGEPAPEASAKPAKVELDIEGMPLDEGQLEEAGEPGPAGAGPDETAPEAEAGPAARKVSLVKLSLLIVPAFLLLAALGFVGYKLFLSAPPREIASGPKRAAWPAPPPPLPGDLPLEPFFFLLSDHQAYVPVEARITIFYENPELMLDLRDDLHLYRDYIFRYIQNQDAGLLTSRDRLEDLQYNLLDLINQQLGVPAVTHLRIEFRR